MAPDPRLARAKKILRDGIAQGKRVEKAASNRSTGTRGRYKCEAAAARDALDALDARLTPRRPAKRLKK